MDYKALLYSVLIVATMAAILTSALVYPMMAIVGFVVFFAALSVAMLYMLLTTP